MSRLSIFSRLAVASISLASLETTWSAPVEQPPPGSQWKMKILQRNSSAAPITRSAAEKERVPSPEPVGETAVAEPTHAALLEIQTDKSSVTKGTISNSDGTSRTFYIIKEVVFVPVAESGRVLRYPTRRDDPSWLETNRFPGTDWITEKHLVQEPGDAQSKPAQELPLRYMLQGLFPMEAQIRRSDKRPISITLGHEVAYEFGPVEVFEGSIQVPETVLQAAREVSRRQQSIQAIHKANTRENR